MRSYHTPVLSGCLRIPVSVVCLCLLSLNSGCTLFERAHDSATGGPFFTPKNYSGVNVLPAKVRRVVLLPSAGSQGVQVEALTMMDEVLGAELQRMGRFEVVALSPQALKRHLGAERISSVDVIPRKFKEVMMETYQADAVMFVDVTTYSPYRTIVAGLRAKLIAVDNFDVLWAFDTVFSTGEPAMVNSAVRFDRKRHPADGPVDLSSGVMLSPSRFVGYAASAAFETLPVR